MYFQIVVGTGSYITSTTNMYNKDVPPLIVNISGLLMHSVPRSNVDQPSYEKRFDDLLSWSKIIMVKNNHGQKSEYGSMSMKKGLFKL